ncbi:acyl carrier protein [Streptomyces cyanogenus]|uniref:Carrier domain-containing protein n=1 Tax=Streptomyces cyanogenus TaxID=80860 RepID=A0ABX7TJU7_STRCY|nr:acyl carrier protein [Streptomyces cyanogenus]QTD96687.1 hypothetical protein S1361_04955 [Streptomyces cyanogenus]
MAEKTAPTEAEVSQKLMDFIRDNFLSGDPNGELQKTTPLLEWGVLDSLKVAMLLNFLRGELGVTVPFEKMSGGNFKDINRISALVCELLEARSPAVTTD